MAVKSGSLVAVVLVAAALSACDDKKTASWGEGDSVRYCTDAQGRRVPDQQCQTHSGGGGNAFLWYYLGRLSTQGGGQIPPMGGVASGGGYRPTAGLSYSSVSEAVARGGFGATGSGAGEGHGAGE
jgi:hypothetical protein